MPQPLAFTSRMMRKRSSISREVSDDARVGRQRFGDLHHLLFGNRQLAHHLVGVEVDLQLVQDAARFLFHVAVGQRQHVRFFPAQEDVFRHGQVAAHVQFLMDDRPAEFLRLPGREVAVFLPENFHAAVIAVVYAAEHLHQRAFPRAVLPQQGHNLARAKLEMHVVQRFDAREAFVYMLHANDDIAHRQSTPAFVPLFLASVYHRGKSCKGYGTTKQGG